MTEEIHSAYQTLGISEDASPQEIKQAWRDMLAVWHPDKHMGNERLRRKAEEQSKRINEAYDILKRYLKDGDIPRSRPRPSTQSQKQESQQQTRRPRPRPSKQSRKQESQQQTCRQETTSEDAHSSQTHEQENRQEQTTKPFEEESLAVKIGRIIYIIFAIIFGAIGGFGAGMLLAYLPLFALGEVSGWFDLESVEGWTTVVFGAMIVSPIVTFFGRIIDTIRAKRQNRPFIGIHEGWFAYTTIGGCGGTIGGMVCGWSVSIIGNEAVSTRIATFIGVVLGARLALSVLVRFSDAGEIKIPNWVRFVLRFVLAVTVLFLWIMLSVFVNRF